MDEHLRVLVEARVIPENARVTKRTGEKEYVLRRSITIYKEDKSKQKLECSGSVFLVDPESGNSNMIASSTELLWFADYSDLYELIEGSPK